MRNFFNYDGDFFNFINKISDVFILSICWLICCIPLITIGAATTSCYYVLTKSVSGKSYYVLKDFFHQFRKNFKQATILHLILSFVTIICVLSIYTSAVSGFYSNGIIGTIYLVFQFFFALEIFIVTTYAYPILARFDLSNKMVLKTAFALGNSHLVSTVCIVLIYIGLLFLAYKFFIFAFIFPGAFFALSSYVFVKVFKKHRPDFDEIINYDDYNNIIS